MSGRTGKPRRGRSDHPRIVDFFTHLFVGRLLAEAMPGPALGWIVTLYSVLPDFDTLSWVFPRLRRYVRHRGITHTLPFGVGAALVGATVCAVTGIAPFFPALLAALLGFASHVGLDVLNWGAPVLWPWCRSPVEWTVHGGFATTAILAATGLIVLALAGPYAGLAAAWMGGALGAYLAFRAVVKLVVARRHPGVRLFPTGNPFVWRVLDAEPDAQVTSA